MRTSLAVLTLVLLVFLGALLSLQSRTNDSVVVGEAEVVVLSEPLVVADDLNIPWELVFLPNGDMFITERPGDLLLVGTDRETIAVSGVTHRGEGGLLGLALHPDFSLNSWIYLYITTTTDNGLENRVERYVLQGTTLLDRTVILDGIPGASNHDGGRLAFGPDGMLYITTGDAGIEHNAQNRENLAGKILRVRDDGSVPADNPFDNEIYSYGHRNVQGIAWDEQGRLWATEHGRSGVRSGYDEINEIIAGGNYGWPDIEGDEIAPNMITPYWHSGANDTWAPSGMAYLDGKLFFAGLRGEALYAVAVGNEASGVTAYFEGDYGRLRTVTVGSDGMLYVLTNNRDGRGTPVAQDDRLIRIDPKTLR